MRDQINPKDNLSDIDFLPVSKYKIIGTIGTKFLLKVGTQKSDGDDMVVIVKNRNVIPTDVNSKNVTSIACMLKFSQSPVIVY